MSGVGTTDSEMSGDGVAESIDRHPTALSRHVERYVARVAHVLSTRAVITDITQRSDPARPLRGCIAVDTAALHAPAEHPGDPVPVMMTWDEATGWCVELRHHTGRSSWSYLHPDLLPTAVVVAEFVVGLALGHRTGSIRPIGVPVPGAPALRLVR